VFKVVFEDVVYNINVLVNKIMYSY